MTEQSENQQVQGRKDSEDIPWEMTVHTMPGSKGALGKPRTARGRWISVWILLACLSPVIASYLTFYVFTPEGSQSYGTIIESQADEHMMPDVQGRLPDGSSVDLRSLRRQWLLVTVADGDCDKACEDMLYLQRQVREMTGKYKERIDRVWLVPEGQPVRKELLPAVQGAFAQVVQLPLPVIESWLQAEDGSALKDHLYVVDPMGRWMMRFPPNADPKKVRRDIGVLLKASNSWDRAGRDSL